VIVCGLTVEASGVASLALVDSAWSALVVLGVVSVGSVALWPATTALLARLTREESRERAFGLQFMLLNAGLGIGGLVSAALADVTRPGSFQLLYVLDAATYLAYIAVVLSLPRRTGTVAPVDAAGEVALAPAGWRDVLADRTLVRVALIAVLVITFGYAQVEAGLAAYAVDVAHLDPRWLGPAFAANTGAIVLGQLVTLRLIRGRRRSSMLAAAAGLWSVSWVVVALAAPADGWAAVLCVVLGLGLFGVGETLWAPISPALVNDLAPEELRGRYNALSSTAWTVSTVIGPAVAGLLIGSGLAAVWVVATVGGTALASRLFLKLRSHLTDFQDGVGPRAP
jgi:MFS family permease